MAKGEYELLADYGSIGTKQVRGTKCEVRLQICSWNGKRMWDLRAIAPDGSGTYIGLTMPTRQVIALRDLLNTIEPEREAEAVNEE